MGRWGTQRGTDWVGMGHEQSVKGLVMKIKDLQHVFTNLHLSLVISNSMIINWRCICRKLVMWEDPLSHVLINFRVNLYLRLWVWKWLNISSCSSVIAGDYVWAFSISWFARGCLWGWGMEEQGESPRRLMDEFQFLLSYEFPPLTNGTMSTKRTSSEFICVLL